MYILWSRIVMGLLVWATWLAECYLCGSADLIFTRTVFSEFSMLYCYLILCLNLVLLFGKNALVSVFLNRFIYLIILKNGCCRSTQQANLIYYKKRTPTLKLPFIHTIDSICFVCKLGWQKLNFI